MNNTPPARPTEPIGTHAERKAFEAEENLHKRQLLLAEQRAIENPPDVRIRAWEKAHDLRMPGDPAHPVLGSIATSTGLTIAQVREEQRARVALRAAKSQSPVPGWP